MGEHAKNSTLFTVNVSFQFVRHGTFSQFVAVVEERNVLLKCEKYPKRKLQTLIGIDRKANPHVHFDHHWR